MVEHNTFTSWQDEETARRYKIFTEKTTMYQELSQVIIDLAAIEPGMTILDLGCGTGITTQAALNVLGSNGIIYALDVSPAMLAAAQAKIVSQQVTFLQADAVSFASLVEQPVDRVVCNSVFWQLKHKPAVMAEIHKVMAPEGRFIFNAPEPYFIFQDIPRSSKVAVLFKQLAAERYGVGPQDLRTIKVFLLNYGFELLATQTYSRIRTAEESYLFMQLPVATAWMDPPLDYRTRMTLLDEAKQKANPDHKSKRRWMYIVTGRIKE